MQLRFFLLTLVTLISSGAALRAANTGSACYGDPPDAHHPWAVHDHNRPQPPLVTPGTFSTRDEPGKPPSDAIVLFDGTDLSQWEADQGEGVATKWIVKKGAMECVPGSGFIKTKATIGDCQLHVEWAAPTKIEGESQGRGNSGVFLIGQVEIQVLDNYNNPTYADGFAASVYGVNPPLANALRPPGEFQTYDIVFRRPIYRAGQCVDPGYVTVFLNGVLVQDHTPLEGATGHMHRSKAGPLGEAGPLRLQDHGNPVRYRNIWYRPLPPRACEGGTDGALSEQATAAKRKEIAATLRHDALKLRETQEPANPLPEMLRLMESLVYEPNDEALGRVRDLEEAYSQQVRQLSADQLAAQKDQIKHLRNVYRYMARFNLLAWDSKLYTQLNQVIQEHNWDKK